jgi:hypothetical protein
MLAAAIFRHAIDRVPPPAEGKESPARSRARQPAPKGRFRATGEWMSPANRDDRVIVRQRLELDIFVWCSVKVLAKSRCGPPVQPHSTI